MEKLLSLMLLKVKKAWRPPTLQDQMGNQYKVVNTHLTDDQETVIIIVAVDGVVVATEDTMIDQKEKRKVTMRTTKTDLRLMKDQDNPIEDVAVDAAEDVAVEEVIRDVEDTADVTVMMMAKVQNIHKTVNIVKVKMVNNVKITTGIHDDSADVHDVHHRARETKVTIGITVIEVNIGITVIEVNKRNVENVITNEEVVVDAVDAQDATSAHASQEPKVTHPRVANLNASLSAVNLTAKSNHQMMLHPPQLKLKVNSSSCFNVALFKYSY